MRLGAQIGLGLAMATTLWACEMIVGANFDSREVQPGSSGGGGGGAELLGLGDLCTSPDECSSDFCVDEVCCESSCDGPCALGCAQDGLEGTCSLHPVGHACGGDPPGGCDSAGACSTGEHLWSAVFGGDGYEEARACAMTPDGDVVVVGEYDDAVSFGGELLDIPGSASRRIFVAKLGSDGTHRWSIALGETGDTWVNDVAVGSGGDIAIIGNFDGTLQLGGKLLISQGPHTTFVLRLDEDGGHDGHARFDGELLYADQAVAVDGEGNVAAAGAYETMVTHAVLGDLSSGGHAGSYVAYLDTDDVVVWWVSSTQQSSGPSHDVAVTGLAMDSAGHVHVSGFFRGDSAFFGTEELPNADPVGQDVFLVQLARADGAVVAAQRYGSMASQWPTDMAINGADHLVMAGSFNESLNFGSGSLPDLSNVSDNTTIDMDVFAVRLRAPDAGHEWSKAYGPFHTFDNKELQVGVDAASQMALLGRTVGVNAMDLGTGALPSSSTDGFFLMRIAADIDGTNLWAKILDPTGSGAAGTRMRLLGADSAPNGITGVCGWVQTDAVDLGGGNLSSAGGTKDAVVATYAP